MPRAGTCSPLRHYCRTQPGEHRAHEAAPTTGERYRQRGTAEIVGRASYRPTVPMKISEIVRLQAAKGGVLRGYVIVFEGRRRVRLLGVLTRSHGCGGGG